MDWLLFFGRFHPLLVHLPIGFLLLVGFLEYLRWQGKISFSGNTSAAMLFASAVSATLACLAGYWLSLGGGYDEQMLAEHQNQGIGVAALAWLAWAAKIKYFKNSIFGLLGLPITICAILLTFVAGHHGGALTHGADYLSQYTPEPFRTWVGLPPRIEEKTIENKPIANINEALVFQDIIHPILKNKCESCHNAQKSKGGLRMDSIELLKKGGENGIILVAGDVKKSELIRRVLLDLEDEKHMPPKGKNQLNIEQVELVRWWISEGASFDKKIKELKINTTIAPILSKLGGGKLSVKIDSIRADSTKKLVLPQIRFLREDEILSQKISVADEKTIQDFRKMGVLVLPVSKESNFLEINTVNYPNFSDKDANKLPDLSEQIIWLKLNDTKITNKTLEEVGKLKNLTRLYLQNTNISDAGMKHLALLENLEYLNIVGTKISDVGLAQLKTLKNLKVVYAWNSQVSQKMKLKEVIINTGLTHQP